MRKRIYIYIAALTLLPACFSTELEFENQYEPVVESYIHQGKQSAILKLSSMISFGSDSLGGEAITGATVYMEALDASWEFVHDDSFPGRYVLEFAPALQAYDSLSLSIELDDRLITSQTMVPQDPPGVTMSVISIYIPKVNDMMDFRDLDMPDPVELTWDNPDGLYYFLDIQNIESNPTAIKPDLPDGHPGGGGFAFQMVTQPTNDQFYPIEPMMLEYFGTHRIIFTSINDEYAFLYNSLDQDSRELNEPYSNIENGLGIFTAFNSDTLYLEVIPIY